MKLVLPKFRTTSDEIITRNLHVDDLTVKKGSLNNFLHFLLQSELNVMDDMVNTSMCHNVRRQKWRKLKWKWPS